jgi:pyruvate,water dikinase
VAERRAEHERWLAETPPESIGGDAPVEAPSGKLAEIKGIAASKGVVTGTARVLATYEQFDKLRPGDILVCATTTPAWTPLFGIAAAVVAEGGGVLSHTAIAAREYGIAAVVGLRAATSLIPDGALITVDGTTGVVRLGA